MIYLIKGEIFSFAIHPLKIPRYGLSTREAAQERGVVVATVQLWIDSGMTTAVLA